jgi:glycosyltransferase involved in cell wall biosynthesis
MPRLSIVIISFNEESNIEDALKSASFADETVVLDSFSTDATPEICRKYTGSFYQEEWRGFALQKQRAVELASNDWVFVLDSDERITDELALELKSVMADGPKYSGYRCARKNHFGGRLIRYGGWYPDYSVRLFDRRSGRFPDRPVHESVSVDGQVGTLASPMLHYTYSDISDYLRRMDRYSTLAAEEMSKRGRKASVLDLVLRPPMTFIKMYFLKTGFMDGYHGLLLAVLYSMYTFTKYAKLKEMG